ncbi:MAG TPA: hypothetical protein VIX59_19630 [Candidatus Binataceae bacterium]
MSRTSIATTLALAALIFTSMACAASIACAAEPEPWNCSGKQHFQHTDDMTYTAKSNSQRHWRLFLMEYEQYTGHHGYSVVTANDLANAGATAGGVIGTGKFFAMAEYKDASGIWNCPSSGAPADSPAADALYDFCFGEGDNACGVALTIRKQHLRPIVSPP